MLQNMCNKQFAFCRCCKICAISSMLLILHYTYTSALPITTMKTSPVKKKISLNVWHQINSVNESMNLIVFRVFLAIVLVDELPPKRGVSVHKNSLASRQQCRHRVELRALMCPFKQSNPSAWLPLI